MQVTIDGVPYAPACISSARIGIAISTHNRPAVISRAIEQHLKHLPAGALVVVMDDGSQPAASVPDGVQLLRLDVSQGIVAAKNASLSALVDAQVMVKGDRSRLCFKSLYLVFCLHHRRYQKEGLSLSRYPFGDQCEIG